MMRVNSIRELKESAAKPVASSFAKKALFAALAKMSVGRLIITEDGQHTAFGEPAELAQITARIDIHDAGVYPAVLQKGMVGCGEAYINQCWSTPDLLSVIRLMAKNMHALQVLDNKSPIAAMLLKIYGWLHINDIKGSRRNISAHYDLGNEFFSLFLDSSMMYSSAVYTDEAQTLEAAAEYKLELICQKLQLTPDDHLLEIGTGWGGFACYAAQHYGCKVTTTTISQEQFNKAQERVVEQGLQDKVTVLLQDYRLLEGTYDKLVSIEMIEAVGHQFYDEYFAKCSSLLKSEGQMLLQSILVSDQRYDEARKNIDFIKRFIFPGGCLPSHSVIVDRVAQHTDMQIMAIQDITYDYAKTLANWRERFHAALPQVRLQGFSEEFIRLWDFYFCYCQGGFMERTIHTAQIVMTKPQWRDSRYPG
jgi:cyclopropane-fatty-acyl-phospholipid synthase